MRLISALVILGSFAASAAPVGEDSPLRAAAAASLQTDVFNDGRFALTPNAWIDVSRSLRRFEVGLHVSALVDPSLSLTDDGSTLWAAWRANDRGDGLRIEAHPFSQKRLRLGAIEPIRVRQHIPGAGNEASLALSGRWSGLRAFLWTQAGKRRNELNAEDQLRSAITAGLGWEQEGFAVTLSALTVDFGPLPQLAAQGGEIGGGTRGLHGSVSFSSGERIPEPVDFTWEASNADRWVVFFPETEPTQGRAWRATLESGLFEQRLTNPDAFGATTTGTWAAGASGLLRLGAFRLHARAAKRPVEFIQLGVPSFPPYVAPSTEYDLQDELSVRVGAEYAFGTGLPRVGFVFATVRPATLEGLTPSATGQRTVVLRDVNLVSLLPADVDPGLHLEAKATLSWQPAPLLGFAAEAILEHDPNRYVFSDDVTGVPEPTALEPNSFGLRVLTQLRF